MQLWTKRTQLIIFTDLDGTLLDHHTYSFLEAQEALDKIKAAEIPLIICSSKTRAESEVWRERLHNNHPFISENGGAIFLPKEGVTPDSKEIIDRDGYKIIELGVFYSELLVSFRSLKNIFGETIKGFSDMDAREIADLTGLSISEAELAKTREYTEPFIFYGYERETERLQENVEALRLNLTRGGRFYHLLGGNDKGQAVRIVTEIYKRSFAHLRTVAVGDSYNDLPMLQEADIPVIVQKPGGSYDENLTILPNLVRGPGIGPKGWNRALLDIMGHFKTFYPG